MTGPRPAPPSVHTLHEAPIPMTPWFDPGELARTGVQSALAAVFGSYADKRELQAALGEADSPPTPYTFENGEFWMDFVADLGDGFHSTYTIAHLLARESLEDITCVDREGRTKGLPRGRVLVMGGDQVYPSATRENYRDRLYGPYEAALPWCEESRNPHLYALPGNHDLYDGLTSFIRLFCQKRWIGAWKTQQDRSYFAARLPGAWWLWGLDFQLEADLDEPQRKYFEKAAREMKPGDRIILCVAAPSWLRCAMGEPKAFDVLDFFLKKVVPEQVQVAVTLTGDLHHYARYKNRSNEQWITAGGGGAYLAATHNLPDSIPLPRSTKDGRTETDTLTREAVYPEASISRARARGAIGFLTRNFSFALLLGALYLFFGWLLEAASGGDFVLLLAGAASPLEAAVLTLNVMRVSVGASLFALAIVLGLAAFGRVDNEDPRRKRTAGIVGALHGFVHLGVAVATMWMLAQLPGVSTSWWMLLLYLALLPTVGAIFAGVVMGGYLVVTNRVLKLHDNAVFSSQSIRDYKNFLRLRFQDDGTLTIYPVAVDRVNTKWKASGAANGKSWIDPAAGKIEYRLAENPVVIRGRSAAAGGAMPNADRETVRRG
jgi:hypothetical protein